MLMGYVAENEADRVRNRAFCMFLAVWFSFLSYGRSKQLKSIHVTYMAKGYLRIGISVFVCKSGQLKESRKDVFLKCKA